ncbi:rRNA biogenesis protein rrp5 [Lactococcus formosensis]|uniref:rRNA biogenesis protein rrp5 n=1 Tax=Lactococcus TaxID=1357 RepID=UPI002435B339|nr:MULTISPECIES: rRNA biogenesis protein rrp5 [Lactococcus]MDG6143167.1 rRNA biogenesis protein rrp5 [Lactococcus formosensis]
MSRMKLLLQVTDDVQALADSLRELVEAMQSGEPEQVESAKPQVKEKPVEAEVKQPTLEEVRGLLARKSQEGKSSEVKALIEKFGASRLSKIQPESYLAVMAEAEVL